MDVPFEVEEKKEPPKQEKKPEKKYTMADVRKKLSSLSSGGKTAEVRELLVKHGANRLSEIKPEDYAVLMEEARTMSGLSPVARMERPIQLGTLDKLYTECKALCRYAGCIDQLCTGGH